MKELNVDIIKDLYINQNLSCCKIAKMFNTSPNNILKLLKQHNIKIDKKRICTKYFEKDIKTIAQYYQNKDWESIEQLYPNIKHSTIHSLMSKHNISYGNRWTESELFILKTNTELSKEELYMLLNQRHSVASIATKMQRLDLCTSNVWTDEEISLLKQYYPLGKDIVTQYLPNREFKYIRVKAKQLGLKCNNRYKFEWTIIEDEFIKNNWKIMSDIVMAKKLNRTFRSVKWRRSILGLFRQDKSIKRYSDLNKYLRRNTEYWKRQIVQKNNHQCVITGDVNIDVHHYVPVNKIIDEILFELKIESKNFNLYTEEELKLLLNAFKIKQELYGGICISKSLHQLFHKMYGFDNTKEQFDIFIQDYQNNYYDEYIKSA